MNSRPNSQTQRMLDVLDARWSVGEAAKKQSTLHVKVASLVAAGALMFSMSTPTTQAFADEIDGEASEPAIEQVAEIAEEPAAEAPAEETPAPEETNVIVNNGEVTVEASAEDDGAVNEGEEPEAEGEGEAAEGIDWTDPAEHPEQSDTVDTKNTEIEAPDDYVEPEGYYYDQNFQSTKQYEFMYEEPSHANGWVGTLHVTYTIGADAEGDQTIDLTAKDLLGAYIKAEIMNYIQYEADQSGVSVDEWIADYIEYNGPSFGWYGDRFGSLYGTLNLETGEMENAGFVVEPGDCIMYDVTIKSESGHTYAYKDGSFRLSSALVDSDGEGDGVIAFDGQDVSDTSLAKESMKLGYNQNLDDHNCMNTLVDRALEAYPVAGTAAGYVKEDGTIATSSSGISYSLITGASVIKVGSYYYAEVAGSGYCVRVSSTYVDTANMVLKKDYKPSSYTAYTYDGSSCTTYKPAKTRRNAYLSEVMSSLNKYLADNYDGSYEAFILDYFNAQLGTSYASVSELLANEKEAKADLASTYTYKLSALTIKSSTLYDNLYQNLQSFVYGNSDAVKAFIEENGDSWNTMGNDLTIADYMASTLTENDAWADANNYFKQLLAAGLTSEEASWVAASYALNLDGYQTGNEYMNARWSWSNSIVLDQLDGKFSLSKENEQGEKIGDAEFYLWYVDDNGTPDDVSDDATMYYTKDADGNLGFVKYDPENKTLTWTIQTTDGELNIDKQMLETIVYYLQEKVAPEGYELDTNIYIICNEEQLAALQAEDGSITVENVANGDMKTAVWVGAGIDSETPLTITFVNVKTPEDSEDSEDSESSEEPTDPTNPSEPTGPTDPTEPTNPSVKKSVVDALAATGDHVVAPLALGFGAFAAAGLFFAARRMSRRNS